MRYPCSRWRWHAFTALIFFGLRPHRRWELRMMIELGEPLPEGPATLDDLNGRTLRGGPRGVAGIIRGRLVHMRPRR